MEPVTFVNRLKGVPPLARLLEDARINKGHGPARMPGNWALVYLGYVVSGSANLKPWYENMSENQRFWLACGFTQPGSRGRRARVPAYQTAYERLRELEEKREVFLGVAGELVRMARRKDARVGAWWYVDGTECQSHAKVTHACGPNDDCPSRRGDKAPRPVSLQSAARQRQQSSEFDGREADAPAFMASSASRRTPIPENGTVIELPDGGARFVAGGHWFESKDPDSRVRSYGRGRYWTGFMNVKAVDFFTGAPIAVEVIPASKNEHEHLPELYAQGVEVCGIKPIALLADKGYTVDAVYDFLLRHDTTPVTPYRRRHATAPMSDPGGPRWDIHGVPLCEHCGLPGEFDSYESDNGGPRLRFWCSAPSTDDCLKRQSISCSRSVRRLLPLWRTGETYQALRKYLGRHEEVHESWRRRWRVGGKELRDRQRRFGLGCQQLRAAAAMVAEWVFVMVRQGWWDLPDGRPERPVRAQATFIDGSEVGETISNARREHGLLGGGYPRPRNA